MAKSQTRPRRRRAAAQQYAVAHAARERASTTQFLRFFRGLTDSVVKAAGRGPVESVEQIFRPALYWERFEAVAAPQIQAALVTGITFEKNWIQQLGGPVTKQALARWDVVQQKLPSISIPMSAEMRRRVNDWIGRRTPGIWLQVSSTVRAELEKTILEGIQNGDSIDEMTARIEQTLVNRQGYKARRIARTENTASMNHGQHLERLDLGIEHKEWTSRFDELTRRIPPDSFDHLSADGQIVETMAPFLVTGQPLLYPGDSSLGASAGNTIQCRCCAVSYIDRSAKKKRTAGPAGGTTAPPAAKPKPPKKPKPAPKPKLPLPPLPVKLPVKTVTPVSPEFAKAVELVLEAIPPEHQKILVDAGVKVRVGDKLTDVVPDLKGVAPPGWAKGTTFDNVEGVYRTHEKEIVASETYLGTDGKWVRSNRSTGTVWHETGHAIDEVVGISKHPDFRAAYVADLAEIEALPQPDKDIAKKLMAYFLQRGRGGRSETVAEGYAIAFNGVGADTDVVLNFKTRFPRSLKAIEAILKAIK